MVRFLEGWYILFVTRTEVAGVIGGHAIHRVEETAMLSVSSPATAASAPSTSHPEVEDGVSAGDGVGNADVSGGSGSGGGGGSGCGSGCGCVRSRAGQGPRLAFGRPQRGGGAPSRASVVLSPSMAASAWHPWSATPLSPRSRFVSLVLT